MSCREKTVEKNENLSNQLFIKNISTTKDLFIREDSRRSNKIFQTILKEVTIAMKRLESLQQRLMEKILEGKKYLENERYNINKLSRIRKKH